MSNEKSENIKCSICQQPISKRDVGIGDLMRQSLLDLILVDHPTWTRDQSICSRCLNKYRTSYVRKALEAERGELSTVELEVVQSLGQQELLSRNLNSNFVEKISFGERLSDSIAAFGGSWRFIILFGIIIFVWIAINIVQANSNPFDPYPFILLNLLLSCIAALQAPVIMMSQNRQEARDRRRAENDYRVNLKAELEIRHLNLKVDELMTHQWQRLLEIQQIQTDIISELAAKGPRLTK